MLELCNASGLRYVGEVSHRQVNGGRPLPLFEPVASEGRSSINTLEGWNAAAEKANRRAFSQVFGRVPMSAEELKNWETCRVIG